MGSASKWSRNFFVSAEAFFRGKLPNELAAAEERTRIGSFENRETLLVKFAIDRGRSRNAAVQFRCLVSVNNIECQVESL